MSQQRPIHKPHLHIMDYRERKREDPDLHTLRRDLARPHPLRPLFNATIDLSNFLSVCWKRLKEKPRLAIVLQ